MSGANLKDRALVLGSGPINPAAESVIRAGLEPFVHEVLEVQRIDLAGRTIIALLISLDAAHLQVIASELESHGARNNLDLAIELQ